MAWLVKDSGGYTGVEAENNVTQIADVLTGLGWSLNAIAGICGCIQRESGFNPWRWQGNRIQPTSIKNQDNPRGSAYGLVQWDSCLKYINSPEAQSFPGYGPNFSDQVGSQEDGTAQLYFINTGSGYYRTTNYPERFSEYKVSDKDAGYLAAAWLYNFERPASGGSTETQVRQNGQYWYEYLTGNPPSDKLIINGYVTPAGSGTITGLGLYEYRSDYTLTAVPADGYTFDHWILPSGASSTRNPLTGTLLDNLSVTAVFTGGGTTQYYVNVIPQPRQGGTVLGEGYYNPGETCAVHAYPFDGWSFEGWYVNGVLVNPLPIVGFIVNENQTWVAHFSNPRYKEGKFLKYMRNVNARRKKLWQ